MYMYTINKDGHEQSLISAVVRAALIIAAWNLNNVTSVISNKIASADEIFLFKSKMLQPSILMRRINF